jgi:hypothetical protein
MTFGRNGGGSVELPGESLAEPARRRRREAVASRAGCVVRTTLAGGNVIEFKFHALPRLSDVLEKLGPDAVIVGMQFGEGEGIGKA